MEIRNAALRFLSALLACCLLLSIAGCGQGPKQDGTEPSAGVPSSPSELSAEETAPPTERQDDIALPEYDPADDCQNRFCTAAGFSIWENGEMMLFSDTSYNYLGYYDKTSGDFGVLCGKPECMHDNAEHNYECGGYAADIRSHIGVAEGRIWFVATNYYANPMGRFLYSEELDGSDRREEFRMPDGEDTGSVQQYYLHRGYIYMNANLTGVKDGEPVNHILFSRVNIKTGKFERIFEDRYDKWSSGMCFVGNKVFMFSASFISLEEETFHNQIVCFNAETGELKTLVDREEHETGALMYKMWADEDENVYYSTMPPDTAAAVYKINVNGEPKLFMDCEDEEVMYFAAILSEGIVSAIGYPRGGDPKDVRLWIRDFEGDTIYKGKLPLDFVRELGIEDFGYGDIQGDRETVYMQVSNGEIGALGSVPDFCFIRMDIISQDELECTLVFRPAQ